METTVAPSTALAAVGGAGMIAAGAYLNNQLTAVKAELEKQKTSNETLKSLCERVTSSHNGLFKNAQGAFTAQGKASKKMSRRLDSQDEALDNLSYQFEALVEALVKAGSLKSEELPAAIKPAPAPQAPVARRRFQKEEPSRSARSRRHAASESSESEAETEHPKKSGKASKREASASSSDDDAGVSLVASMASGRSKRQ